MEDSPTRSERPMVNSVVQAIAILRHLGALAGGEGVNAIARATGISPSSCFNVLRTLVAEDLVGFDPATKRYSLGLGTVDLGRAALGGNALVRAAEGPMATLADRHDTPVGLWRLTGGRLVLVALAESAAGTRIHMVVGQRQPASAGASGRAVLASRGLTDVEIAEAYVEARWHRAPGERAFIKQVRRAESNGWALDQGESIHGIATAATTIFDRTGAVRFGLSASLFDGREDRAGMDRIGRDLRDTARELTQRVYGRTASGNDYEGE